MLSIKKMGFLRDPKWCEMDIKEFVAKVKSGEINVVEYTEKVLEDIEQINSNYNYFSVITKELALEQAKKVNRSKTGKLAGVPISIKDCICVKGVESSASSDILKGYKPVFNATVVKKLIDEGAIIVGKTVQDEFGFGGFSMNVGNSFKVPYNPFDIVRSCGGSSGGSGGITQKSRYLHVSIGESTGGSIACPASFCGVYGFTPSYGVVSRYGLMDYGSSLDKIGPMAKSLDDCKKVFDVIKGHDIKDSTSLDFRENEGEVKKVAIIKESFNVNPKIKDIVINKIQALGYEYEEVSLPVVDKYALASYSLIAMSEASTNLAKYCGLRYGYQPEMKEMYNDYFSKVRSETITDEAKRRIILGTFARMAGYRDAYYLKALKVRTLIINEYRQKFKEYDILLSPTMPILPPALDEVKYLEPLELYKMDQLTIGVNLAGLPHISLNAGFVDGLPVGLMLIGDQLKDNNIFKALEGIDGS